MSLLGLLLVVVLSTTVHAQSRGELRLVRGSTTSYNYTSGRLEIYMNGRWGTICNDADFGRTEATVACQQLGWSGVLSYGYSSSLGFGQGNGTILLDDVSCSSSNYLHLLSCQYSTRISFFCDHSDDVAVYCYSTRLSDSPYALQVRLAGGSYPSQGRVEVYCNGQWGTICNTSGFGAVAAETVCRQLGYTDAISYRHLNLPGSSSQPIWLSSFSCGLYSDSCLDSCTSCPVRGITSCTHSSDVTVQCDYQTGNPSGRTSCPAQSRGELRLVRGNTTSYNYTSGRLEIYVNGRWGTICNDADFGLTEAIVACQQLGWSGVLSYGYSSSLGFGQGNGTILLDDVSCSSTSYLHLLSCQYSTVISSSCDHSDDVAVRCYSTRLSDNPYALQVRLAGGSYPSQGRVEVYCNGQWGTICSTSGFGAVEAETVCRQLGYTDAIRYKHLNLPGSSSQPIWLSSFSCGLYSDSCLDICTSCPVRGITSCTHSSDVTVQCDYQTGSPSRKTSCPSSSGGGGGGTAQSRGELRLVRGSTTSYSFTSGRLEIYMNGRWGTICNDADFGRTEATVACQQLGWSGASSYGYSSSLGFGQGSGTILLDDVSCSSSNYLHLLSCQYSTRISSSCDHSDDVAVRCYSTRLSDSPYALQVRLVGGSYPSQGRVEVYCNGQWGTICSTSGFGSAEAETVCRQLGYTDAIRYKHLNLPGSSSQPIWLSSFSCGLYSDSCLDSCTSCPVRGITSCTHSSDVTVQCDYQTGTPSRKTSCSSSSGGGGGGGGTVYTAGGTTGGTVVGVIILVCCCVCCCIGCKDGGSSSNRSTYTYTSSPPAPTVKTVAQQQDKSTPPAANQDGVLFEVVRTRIIAVYSEKGEKGEKGEN